MKNKRFLSMLLCLAMAVSCLAGMTVSASADDVSDVKEYTVKNGDYLYRVCKNNGLDYYTCKSAIMILNGWSTETQCNRIIPGQTIILPVSNAVAKTVKTSATSTSSKTESVTINGVTYSSSTTSTISTAANSGDSISYYLVAYTVKSGDYIAKICSDLGTSYTAYKSIINSVNGLNSTKIYAGKVLYIPVSSAPSSGSFYAVMAHRVDTGETMTTICSSYGANSSSTITKGVNEGTNLNYLQAGQVVYIPVASSAISAVATTGSASGTVSGTGSASASGDFAISFTNAQHGSAYAMVNSTKTTEADSGETVIIVTEGEEGYAQKALTVVRTDTKTSVPVSDNSFTMPDSDVKISVTYAKSKTITKAKTKNGSYTVLVNGSESDEAAYGSRVFLEFSPDVGYMVDTVTYTGNKTTTTVNSDSDGDYLFNMPNYNIKLNVTFKKASYNDISDEVVDKDGNAINKAEIKYSVGGTALSSAYPKAAKGAVVTAVITPDEGWGVKKIYVEGLTSGNEISATKIEDNEYSFKMPGENVKLTVTLEQVQKYEVVQTKVTGGTLTFFTVRDGKNVFTKYFYPGEKVYIKPVADNKKELASVSVKLTNGKASIEVQPDTYDYFVMPENWVTVTPKWQASTTVSHGIYSSDLQNGTYKCYDSSDYEIHSAEPGDTVKIVVTMDIPYGLKELQVIRCKSSGGYEQLEFYEVPGEENAFTFDMPDDNVAIKIFSSTSKYVAKEMKIEGVATYLDAETGDDVTGKVTAFKSFTKNKVKLKVLASGTDVVNDSTYSVVEGTKVQILMSNLMDGYEVEKVTALVDGETEYKTITPDSEGRYYYTIQRSECDAGKITFYVQIKAYPYEVMYSSPKNGSYTINGTSGVYKTYAGAEITIADMDPNDSTTYEFNKLIIDDADQTVNVDSSGEYKFTMPAWDVKTQVTFKES